MSAREFAEWQEYYKIEPFGDDWLQAGVTASAIANSSPWVRKRVKPGDFIPRVKARKSPEEIEREMMQQARMHNKRLEQQQQRIEQRRK